MDPPVVTQVDLYIPSDLGPYRVVVRNDGDNKMIDAMRIGQILSQKEYKSVVEIKKNARNSVVVTFSSFEEANKITNDDLNKKYKIFIPKSFIYVFGYIKGIDRDMEMDGKYGLINELKIKYPNITEVNRIKYKNKEGKEEESARIKLAFRAKTRPQEIKAFNTIKKVFFFRKVLRLCDNCGRFGHMAQQCKSTTTGCSNCKSTEHETCRKDMQKL